MSVNSRIIAAVTPLVPVCVPEPYTPSEEESAREYCTFQYLEQPDSFGDDGPEVMRCTIQLHYFAPLRPTSGSNNTLDKRRALRRALAAAGFTHPGVVDASDLDGQHFVFEFEALDWEV